MDSWLTPQWAEPEANAQADLHLLQYLPAQAPTSGRITSRFGPRRAPHGAFAGRYQFHEGIDIAVFTGTPVVAPGPGTIVGIGFGHRFGRYVRIRHEEVGLETLFAHLSSVEPGIRYGTQVYRGQVVARSGNSGRSTGPHLHFEFRTVREQFPVDPFKVYALYYQSLDRIAHFPIASALAELSPYHIEDRLGIAADLRATD